MAVLGGVMGTKDAAVNPLEVLFGAAAGWCLGVGLGWLLSRKWNG